MAETGGTHRHHFDHEFVASGDYVFVVFANSGERNGRAMEHRSLSTYRLSDGKIVDNWLTPLDEAATTFWR